MPCLSYLFFFKSNVKQFYFFFDFFLKTYVAKKKGKSVSRVKAIELQQMNGKKCRSSPKFAFDCASEQKDVFQHSHRMFENVDFSEHFELFDV